MIPLCEHDGIGVIPWSPLARGMLARSRPTSDAPPTSRAEHDTFGHELYAQQVDWNVIDAVQRIAAARGVSAAQVALAWLLSKPAVTAPIVGATKPAHLIDAIAAVELELSQAEITELETGYTPHRVLGH